MKGQVTVVNGASHSLNGNEGHIKLCLQVPLKCTISKNNNVIKI